MRSDMYKVIVERPRKHKDGYVRAARLRNDIDGPSHLGMRAGYGYRSLNENLAPLRRFLMKQIGRPWGKVQSEISKCIDGRNTVQQHILQHIDDFIATQVQWRGAELIDLNFRQSRFDNALRRQPLYVDPRTGLICANKQFRSWRREYRAAAVRERDQIAARRRVLDARRWLMLLEGQWYEVQITSLPEIEHEERVVQGKRHQNRVDRFVFDVVLKQNVRRRADENITAKQRFYFDATDRYAVSKRQLSKREMNARGLRAEPK